MRTVEQILERYKVAKTSKDKWLSIYQDVYKYTMPNRDLYNTTSEGSDKMDSIYDSTGMIAVENFVNKIQASLTPPARTWFNLKAGPAIASEQKDSVQEALDSVSMIFWNALQSSNFNTAIGEFYHDLVAGTACMLISEGTESQPFKFTAIPNIQISISEGVDGMVDEIYREFEIKSDLIKHQWKDAKVDSQDIQDKKTSKLIESTYYDYDNQIWIYNVILCENKKQIVERTYSTSPWIISRWSKLPGESFGRGPAIYALPDIKMLNKMMEYSIMGAGLKILPSFTIADDDTLDYEKFTIHPLAMNPVSRNGGPNGPSVMALQVGGDINLEQYKIDDTRMQIKKLMYDMQLPADAGPVRSATEIAERARNLQADIGSAFGRLTEELIRPIVIRCLDILKRKALIPNELDIKSIDDYFVKIEITSPISKMQSIEDIQSIVQGISLVSSFSPELANTLYDIDGLAREISEAFAIPAKYIRDDKEITAIRQQQAEANQQAMAEQRQLETDERIIEKNATK